MAERPEKTSKGGEIATSPARRLGSADAAIFETHVVPRYLSLFAERLIEMTVAGADARVCHLHCRTGYPDRELLDRLPGAHVYGCDESEHAIALAKAKVKAQGADRADASGARGVEKLVADYRVVEGYPLPFPVGAFSHAFTIHPLAAPAERRRMMEELARIVAPRGQALVAMPLRGSFGEIADLLRECALKLELPELTSAVEAAVQLRPTDDMFAKELAAVGFEYVDVDLRMRTLRFANGRDFFDDPVTRLLLLPEFRVNLAMRDIDAPLGYVREAIDKYWSDGEFELTVNVGVVSGRRRA
jgi:SAM-dependent methyltransferase